MNICTRKVESYPIGIMMIDGWIYGKTTEQKTEKQYAGMSLALTMGMTMVLTTDRDD